MKIVVLNGSPKGDLSVTLQYVRYLEKVHPEVSFETVNIAQRIRKIETDPEEFERIIAQVRSADGLLWAFPLYILIVHAHYKRFIELIFERGVMDAFEGKYAASLSTSIHYFDHTAHNYVHGICDDLGMRYVEAFSPEMQDLMGEQGRNQLEQFGRRFLGAIEAKLPTQRQYPPLSWRDFVYKAAATFPVRATGDRKVVIVYDGDRPGSNVLEMVRSCKTALSGNVQVIDLNQIDIQASCRGCLQCGYNNVCAFEGKDGFIDFYRSTIMTADVLVYVGTVVDRYLSSRWKTFFDRSFFNTHTPVLIGKQLAFVISGPVSQLPNLREILYGYAEFQQANVVGLVSDEYGDSSEIESLLRNLMTSGVEMAEARATRPMTFLGVGGLKVFRDDIWGNLRMVFRADHRAYQKLGVYKTFPQHDWGSRIMNAIMLGLLGIPSFREGFNRQMTHQMIKPAQKVIEAARPLDV
jgi:multimeric flavodoxin WrbA